MASPKEIEDFLADYWRNPILPALIRYMEIPNLSPQFDRSWAEHGHMDRAVELARAWAQEQLATFRNSTVQVVQLMKDDGTRRTPILFIDIPGNTAREDTVLLYGHLDKQPEMTGWRDGLGAWTPMLVHERLYGRGGADDGYALFAAIAAIKTNRKYGRPHARHVILIECCEESGSPDLPAYIEHLAAVIGEPSLVVCLDSGCGNYDQLWLTTSLRGLVGGDLTVSALRNPVHSGNSGLVPEAFTVASELLNRIRDPRNGKVTLPDLAVRVPSDRYYEAHFTGEILGDALHHGLGLLNEVQPLRTDGGDQIISRTWEPSVTIIGMKGLPTDFASAGNVVHPKVELRLSVRIPPGVDPVQAGQALTTALTREPPYGAHVTFEVNKSAAGWNSPPLVPWLRDALNHTSHRHFGKPMAAMGEGGSIPFMDMLGRRFPKAQFVITGVLGPDSNAHGPNEFLDVNYARRLTACVADVLTAHAEQLG